MPAPFIASSRDLTGPGCRMKKPDTSLFMLPIQANFVELNFACDAAAAQQRLHRNAPPDQRDLGAVLRRGVEQIVGQIERTGARPVLRHDGGIARQVLAHMARQQAPVGVVAEAGRREADRDPDLLAGETDRRGLRLRRRCRAHDCRAHMAAAHSSTLVRGNSVMTAHSAARARPMPSRCAITSSACITSAYLWCRSNRLILWVSSARS